MTQPLQRVADFDLDEAQRRVRACGQPAIVPEVQRRECEPRCPRAPIAQYAPGLRQR